MEKLKKGKKYGSKGSKSEYILVRQRSCSVG